MKFISFWLTYDFTLFDEPPDWLCVLVVAKVHVKCRVELVKTINKAFVNKIQLNIFTIFSFTIRVREKEKIIESI